MKNLINWSFRLQHNINPERIFGLTFYVNFERVVNWLGFIPFCWIILSYKPDLAEVVEQVLLVSAFAFCSNLQIVLWLPRIV